MPIHDPSRERGRNTEFRKRADRPDLNVLSLSTESPRWVVIEWETTFPADATWNPALRIVQGLDKAAIEIVGDALSGSVCVALSGLARVELCELDRGNDGTSESVLNVFAHEVASWRPPTMTRSIYFAAVGAGDTTPTKRPPGARTLTIQSKVGVGPGPAVSAIKEYSDEAATDLVCETPMPAGGNLTLVLGGKSRWIVVTTGAAGDVGLVFSW